MWKLYVHGFFAFFTFVPMIPAYQEKIYGVFFVCAGFAFVWFLFIAATMPRRPKTFRQGNFSGVSLATANALMKPTHVAPTPPMMTQPVDGTISVGIKKTDDSVWVWIRLTETTKQTLSKVMKEPVDQYPLDVERIERSIREHVAGVETTFHDAREKQEYVTNFRKKMMAPTNILLRDMLSNPFRYPVKNAQEAAEYTDRLKTKVFPKIKAMIEGQAHPEEETFQV
jgi:hypothetical protein